MSLVGVVTAVTSAITGAVVAVLSAVTIAVSHSSSLASLSLVSLHPVKKMCNMTIYIKKNLIIVFIGKYNLSQR